MVIVPLFHPFYCTGTCAVLILYLYCTCSCNVQSTVEASPYQYLRSKTTVASNQSFRYHYPPLIPTSTCRLPLQQRYLPTLLHQDTRKLPQYNCIHPHTWSVLTARSLPVYLPVYILTPALTQTSRSHLRRQRHLPRQRQTTSAQPTTFNSFNFQVQALAGAPAQEILLRQQNIGLRMHSPR